LPSHGTVSCPYDVMLFVMTPASSEERFLRMISAPWWTTDAGIIGVRDRALGLLGFAGAFRPQRVGGLGR
jgi:hypothetical protein